MGRNKTTRQTIITTGRRMGGVPLAPLATRGFYGAYRGRTRPELKFVDATSQNIAVTTSWSVVLINGILQGTDYNQRIGRKVMLKSVLFNGNHFPGATVGTDAAQGCYSRFVIVYDSQPNSAATVPVGTDIFATNDPNTALNLNNRDRFKVLIDVRKQIGSFKYTTGVKSLMTGSPPNAYWNKYKKINLEQIFSGTAATIGSIGTGALYFCFIGDNPVCDVDYYTRVRYADN